MLKQVVLTIEPKGIRFKRHKICMNRFFFSSFQRAATISSNYKLRPPALPIMITSIPFFSRLLMVLFCCFVVVFDFLFVVAVVVACCVGANRDR